MGFQGLTLLTQEASLPINFLPPRGEPGFIVGVLFPAFFPVFPVFPFWSLPGARAKKLLPAWITRTAPAPARRARI